MRTWLLFLLAGGALHAAIIKGSVVENQTGKALARTLVSITPLPGSAGPTATARTNTYGMFEFVDLPGGAYLIHAARRGFMTAQYGQKNWRAIDILDLSITLKLTLNVDATRSRIDVMSWVADLQNPQNLIYTALPPTSQSLPHVQVTGTFLGEPVNFVSNSASAAFVSLLEKVLIVTLTTGGELDPGGIIRGKIRDLVYSGLITPDHFTSERVLDSINNEVNSWLLGGITWTDDHGVLPGVNNCKVVSVKPDVANDQILIGYTG